MTEKKTSYLASAHALMVLATVQLRKALGVEMKKEKDPKELGNSYAQMLKAIYAMRQYRLKKGEDPKELDLMDNATFNL